MNATDMKKGLTKRTEESPMSLVRQSLERMRPEIAKALPSQIAEEKFLRATMTWIQMKPELLDADRKSLLASTMKCAQDGLLPDGREAALVNFNCKGGGKAVQYMPMVGGLLKKLRQSGELRSICAHVIHEKDDFDYWIDTMGEHLAHRPVLFGERGKPRGVYALAQTTDGGVYVEVLSMEDIEKVRSVSRAKSDDSPWATWWEEMAKKSALRRLMKRLPSSTDLESALQADNETYEVRRNESIDTSTGEVFGGEVSPVTYADVMERMKAANNLDELSEAAADIDLVPADQRPGLYAEWERMSNEKTVKDKEGA